ncbi:hypothetical protein [Actinoplanes sp. NBRC 103695]|uniref:hypothetical protein n=1 Tax=Actinoplanes sp. NBRC 103695 TaxID=3032202 RepID=UPI0024A2F30E|nr:hypothetical protein [Actinoplanes sp. NBRC 103695]GLZ01015.1 hypothetical protein Acsp02_82670 [Actinoplanes sp. NBRC 103695]
MSEMLSSAETDVIVAYRLVGLIGGEVDEDLPTPSQIGHPWLSAGTSSVLLQSAEDIGQAQFRFELWDGAPPQLGADWPHSEVVTLVLTDGGLNVDQIDAGSVHDVFDVGEPGRYRVRLAWREADWDPMAEGPQAWLLAQFWREIMP